MARRTAMMRTAMMRTAMMRAVTMRAALFACLLSATRALTAQAADDPLMRSLALHLTGASLDDALRAVERGAAVRLSYSSDLLPPSAHVTLERERTTVGAALREILRGTQLGMVVAGSGHIVILRAPLLRAAGATDTVAATGSRAAAAVATNRAQDLDQVLVMGTPAAGAPARELTTAVSVVSAEQVLRAHGSGMAQLFRSTVPGVVAWDLGSSGPIAQVGSVRGSSSFSANYLKTYLDGVELASPYMLFAIDPDALERIEVIRGPQGSALYGSDAISGVAHLVTKKGTMASGWRPRLEAGVQGGSVETSFAASRAVAQHHVVAADGGGLLSSYHGTGVLSDNGAYVSGARAGSSGLIGAARAVVGPVLLEATARSTNIGFNTAVNPLLRQLLGMRAPPRIAAATDDQTIHEQTVGVTAIYEPTQQWRQTLVVGYDRNWGTLAPQRNPASVADALLGASEEDARRTSLRYSSSVRFHASPAAVSTLTAGLEFSRLERERSGSSDVIYGDAVSPAPSRSVALYVDTVSNTGAFAQVKLDVRGALFLVAGVRGERNSSFGAGYGTAWAPMAGASYVRQVDALTVKVRAAYGKGIRPPPPSARRALATREYRQLANPDLAPETQAGVEGGIDLELPGRFALSITGFDQRAEGLIQHVLPNPRVAPRSIQLQNVGQIANRGLEAQASGQLGSLAAEATLATVTSRVEALSRFYTGDLRVGDRVPEVPSWSGAAALTATRGGLSLSAGVTYLGPWTGYDWLSYYAALVSGETSASLRDYWTQYPAAVRPNIALSHDVTPRFTWFLQVDNLTSAQRDTRDNLQISAGRTTWLGFRVTTP